MKQQPFAHMGITTIFLIFTVLCLGTLSLLSLGQARYDRALCKKAFDHTMEYYDGVSASSQYLNMIDSDLLTAFSSTHSEKSYYNKVEELLSKQNSSYKYNKEKHFITFNVPVSDKQQLCVKLSLFYPAKPDESFYQIDTYHTELSKPWNPDKSQNLFQGGTQHD